jgi:hypothetical protein
MAGGSDPEGAMSTAGRLTVEDLIAREEIGDLLSAYARGVDDLDRDLFTSIFTDEVLLDLSSWNRVPAAPARMDLWFDEMAALMTGFDATEHLLVNREVRREGATATSRCAMLATHHLAVDGDRRVYILGGYYEHRHLLTAQGWRIAALKLTVRWELGDRGLFRLARDRVSRRSVRRTEAG